HSCEQRPAPYRPARPVEGRAVGFGIDFRGEVWNRIGQPLQPLMQVAVVSLGRVLQHSAGALFMCALAVPMSTECLFDRSNKFSELIPASMQLHALPQPKPSK